jgi:hypothetical protein
VKKKCVAKYDVYVKLSFFTFGLVSGKAACFLQSPRTLVLLLVVCRERERRRRSRCFQLGFRHWSFLMHK